MCQHRKGEVYDGKLCWWELEEAVDAYEWSFVAVPAQRDAGVIKGFRDLSNYSLEELAQLSPRAEKELHALEDESLLGYRWKEETQEETVRLFTLCFDDIDLDLAQRIVYCIDADELVDARKALRKTAEEKMPAGAQLCYGSHTDCGEENDHAFLV